MYFVVCSLFLIYFSDFLGLIFSLNEHQRKYPYRQRWPGAYSSKSIFLLAYDPLKRKWKSLQEFDAFIKYRPIGNGKTDQNRENAKQRLTCPNKFIFIEVVKFHRAHCNRPSVHESQHLRNDLYFVHSDGWPTKGQRTRQNYTCGIYRFRYCVHAGNERQQFVIVFSFWYLCRIIGESFHSNETFFFLFFFHFNRAHKLAA